MAMRKTLAGLAALSTAAVLYVGIGSAVDSNRLDNSRMLEDSNRPITGTVLEEVYERNLSPVPASGGIVSYSNETVKLDSTYSLKVRSDDGKLLGVSVIDNNDNIKYSRNPDIEGLDRIVGVGTRIQFPRGNINEISFMKGVDRISNETYFHPDTQIGNKRADRITVLD